MDYALAAALLKPLKTVVVAASFLEFSRLGDDRRQRLSSNFVAQWAATFGVRRNHTDANATQQDRGREAVEECTPSSMLKRGVTLREPIHNFGRSIRQVEHRSFLYT